MLVKAEEVARRLDRWRSRLIDLTRRNPLLHLVRDRQSSLAITRPNMEEVWARLQQSRDSSWRFWLPPDEEEEEAEATFRPVASPRGADGPVPVGKAANPPREQFSWLGGRDTPRPRELSCDGRSSATVVRTLANLYRRSREDFQERGLQVLHLAFGILEWPGGNKDERLRSPLLLLPVRLVRDSLRDPFELEPVEQEPIVNPALQAALRQRYELELPSFDPDEGTPAGLLREVESAFADRPGWRVERACVLATFSFFKAVIYKDLTENADGLKEHWLVRAMAGRAGEESPAVELPEEHDLDCVQDPEQTFHILDADASQRLALVAAGRGQSFVLHGPPGTGKSQTIANLVGERIALGQTVLFVSEKMAALEVVYNHLKRAGLVDFCLELHSHKASRGEVVRELERCLALARRSRPVLDESACERLRQQCERLNDHAHALHQSRPPLRCSLWHALGELAARQHVAHVPLDLARPADASVAWFDEALLTVRLLQQRWAVFEQGQNHPWWGFRAEVDGLVVRDELSGLIDQLVRLLDHLGEMRVGFAARAGVDGSLSQVLQAADLLDAPAGCPEAWLTMPDFAPLSDSLERLAAEFDGQERCRQELASTYGEGILGLAAGTAEQIGAARDELVPLLAADASGPGLLAHRQALRQWAQETERQCPAWRADAQLLARWLLRLEVPDPSLQVVSVLGRLFDVCQSATAPEPGWLFAPKRLEACRAALARLGPDQEKYRARREELLRRYDERFFTLQLDHLAERLGGPYQSAWRFLRPGFHSDMRAIGRVSLEGQVPATIRQDVLEARALLRLKEQIERDGQGADNPLGRYFRGIETSSDTVERGLRNAEEATALLAQLGMTDVPARLREVLGQAEAVPAEVQAAAARLSAGTRTWGESTRPVRPCLPALVPGSDRPLGTCRLSQVEEYARRLRSTLDRLAALVDPLLAGRSMDLETLTADVRRAEELRRWAAAREADRASLQERLGPVYQGLQTDWAALRQQLAWAKRVRAFFAKTGVPAAFRRAGRGELAGVSETLRGTYSDLRQALRALENHFDPPAPAFEGQRLSALPPEDLRVPICRLREQLAELPAWVEWRKLLPRLEALGLGDFWKRLQVVRPRPDQVVDVFVKAFYFGWVDGVLAAEPVFRRFTRQEHELVIDAFRELDRKLIADTPARIAQLAEGRRPHLSRRTRDIPGSETGTLRYEASKKSRWMPLRKLFEALPNLLPRLKPCLLMSPLSVSQFLGPNVRFDLVVFDEASQICTEDALGAIYRGKQVIIAGDHQQLPPTAFFSRDWEGDELAEDDDGEGLESVLDQCLAAGLPEHMLRWHYRSRHEGLIAFSNRHFYDDRLVTFPAARAGDPALGVEFRHVPDGVYARGGRRNNPREAAVVADLALAHYRSRPDKTLGVIAFSQAQMLAIENEIERRLAREPELERYFKGDRLEGFFVKNLETVQGDERDFIILGTGYGRDEKGRLLLNFGPLNRPGGERRLNVAVTRAREKLILVSSLRPADFDPTGRALGLQRLHEYLCYAADARSLAGPAIVEYDSGTPSPLALAVAAELQQRGYEVVPRFGRSVCRLDLAVRHPDAPDRFLLGIDCDGLAYREVATARDRDRLRQEVLGRLGWRLHRVWSIDWALRREAEVAHLLRAVEEARKTGPPVPVPPPFVPPLEEATASPPASAEVAADSGAEVGSIPGVVPYRLRDLVVAKKFRGVEFHDPSCKDERCRLLVDLVEAEGPIHLDVVTRRLREAWGVERTGERVRRAVEEAVEQCVGNQRIRQRDDFLWPKADRAELVRQRSPELHEMYRENIAPEEIQEALRLLVAHGLAMPEEVLLGQTAALFGYGRLGDALRLRFREQMAELVRRGVLVMRADRVTLAR